MALTEGWGWPGNSRKAHYFKMGEATSVCSRWLYGGSRTAGDFKSPDDCAPCRKWVDKHAASSAPRTGGDDGDA